MSKCRPDKKKIRRRLQSKINQAEKRYAILNDYANSRNVLLQKAEDRIEELRVALRNVGNDHNLKYSFSDRNGTLIQTERVSAREIDIQLFGKTLDGIEHILVGRLAKELIERGFVRIEQIEPLNYDDKLRGCVRFSARVDVIPWYECVKPEIVYLDDDRSRMAMSFEKEEIEDLQKLAKMNKEHRERIRQKIIEEGENA